VTSVGGARRLRRRAPLWAALVAASALGGLLPAPAHAATVELQNTSDLTFQFVTRNVTGNGRWEDADDEEIGPHSNTARPVGNAVSKAWFWEGDPVFSARYWSWWRGQNVYLDLELRQGPRLVVSCTLKLYNGRKLPHHTCSADSDPSHPSTGEPTANFTVSKGPPSEKEYVSSRVDIPFKIGGWAYYCPDDDYPFVATYVKGSDEHGDSFRAAKWRNLSSEGVIGWEDPLATDWRAGKLAITFAAAIPTLKAQIAYTCTNVSHAGQGS
jgi:hypothetical protein